MDNESDELILVDSFDRPIGGGLKLPVHREGRLHRAFSVFIVDDGKMLVQRRNPAKYHSGNLWANACCSHPRAGEETREAAMRRLREETGIVCELEELYSFVYRTVFDDGISEYEYDHVFLGTYRGPVDPDPEEIAELAWVLFDDLAASLVHEPDRFASWFLIAAPEVLRRVAG